MTKDLKLGYPWLMEISSPLQVVWTQPRTENTAQQVEFGCTHFHLAMQPRLYHKTSGCWNLQCKFRRDEELGRFLQTPSRVALNIEHWQCRVQRRTIRLRFQAWAQHSGLLQRTGLAAGCERALVRWGHDQPRACTSCHLEIDIFLL